MVQTLTESVLKENPPGGLFDGTLVGNLFPDDSVGARKVLIHRAVRKGEILRLKPGLFCLDSHFRREDPHPFVVASLLHAPSHISLESALRHHGLIPEAVFGVSSVTQRRSRNYDTPMGTFSFKRVPSNRPRAGVETVSLGRNVWAFVASPFRAVADLVYLRKGVSWQQDGFRFLHESMRIEIDDLQKVCGYEGAVEVIDSVRDGRTRAYMKALKEEFAR